MEQTLGAAGGTAFPCSRREGAPPVGQRLRSGVVQLLGGTSETSQLPALWRPLLPGPAQSQRRTGYRAQRQPLAEGPGEPPASQELSLGGAEGESL